MARFEGGTVVFETDWPAVKNQIDTRNLDFRFEEDATAYEIFAVDENFFYRTIIYKSGQAPQDQSTYDTYRADFEANYKNRIVDFNNTEPVFISTVDGYSVVLKDGAAPTANDGYGIAVIGYDGSNYRMLKSDTSGRPVFVGAGTAGTPSGGVLTIQGDPSGTALPIFGTVAATQSGTWTVQPGNTANTTPWLITINQGGNSATVTASNALKIDGSAVTQPVSGTVTANAGTGNFNNASVSTTGSAVPASATYVGFSDGTNLQAPRVFDVDTGGGTQYVQGVNLRLSAGGGSVEFGTASNPIRIDPTGSTIQPVSGTVTANAGTGNFTVVQSTASSLRAQLASESATGSVINATAVQVGGSDGTNLRSLFVDTSGRLIVIGAAANGAPSAGNPVLVAGSDGTNARSLKTAADGTLRIDPTGTTTQPVSAVGNFNDASVSSTGSAVPASSSYSGFSDGTNLQGARVFDLDSGGGTQYVLGVGLRKSSSGGSVEFGTSSDPVRIDPTGTTTQPVSGTVTANQGTSPWVNNISQFGGNNVVTGTGASGAGIPRVTVSNDSNILATQSGTWTVAQGAPNSLANKWPVQVTDGTNTMPTGDAVGRAIFEKITDGTNTAAVKAASTEAVATDPALVVALSPNNTPFSFGGDDRLRVSQETMLFFDNVDGTTIDTNKWTQSQSGMTQSQTGGNLTLNNGNSTTSGNYSILTSNKQVFITVEFPLYAQFRAKLVPQTNAVIELGFGNVATTSAPTDGVFLRIDTSGNLKGVINFNGTETLTSTLTSISSTTFYNYEVTIYEDHASFEVQSADGTTNVEVELAIPSTQGSPTSVGHLPVFARVYNSSATSAGSQIVIASVNVQQMDLNMNKSWGEQAAGANRSALLDPSTFAQSANYSNSAAPASATLSNTAAGYTTLGGLWQFAAVAGAETDYALFAYQVPTGFQLYVWTITITAFITGAQSSTNPTLLQWAVAANSSAVSLATGAPNPPIRTPIGMQQTPKTANIGDTFSPEIISYSPKTPIVVNSGKYLHIILRIPIANATTNQIIRGSCTVEGYFE